MKYLSHNLEILSRFQFSKYLSKIVVKSKFTEFLLVAKYHIIHARTWFTISEFLKYTSLQAYIFVSGNIFLKDSICKNAIHGFVLVKFTSPLDKLDTSLTFCKGVNQVDIFPSPNCFHHTIIVQGL